MSTMATAWDDLVATAVQGTTRRPPDLTAWLGEFGEDAATVRGDPSAQLLAVAALATARRRAGVLPGVVGDLPDPAPAETRPVAHSLTSWFDDLAEGRPVLLSELLNGVQQRGLVLEPTLAPRLLELAVVNHPLREVALAACGTRGPWLAAQNPRWAGLVDRAHVALGSATVGTGAELDESPWELGDPAARLAWLRRARETHPERAAEIVAAALAPGRVGEKAEMRQGVIAVIAGRPTAADAEVLENALDDRSQGVRDAAAVVLTGLEGTAYERRAVERARRWVQLESRKGLRGRRTLHVTLEVPAELHPADVRDGLGREVVALRAGVAGGLVRMRASWLVAVIEATPLRVWATAGTPQELVAAEGSDWVPALREGWVRRAVREGDQAWADALLGLGQGIIGKHRLAAIASPRMVDETTAALIVRARATGGVERVAGPEALRQWLLHLPHPWGQRVLRAVFEALPDVATRDHVLSWRPVLDDVARFEPPSTADSVSGVGPACPPGWAPMLARTARDLARRGELTAALDEAARTTARDPAEASDRHTDSSTLPTIDERRP